MKSPRIYCGRCGTHEADRGTLIGPKTNYFKFATEDALRVFVGRCHPDAENMADFERDIRYWSRGSIYVNLTDEQYAKLEKV